MVTINSWYRKHVITPLIVLAMMVFVLWLGFHIYQLKTSLVLQSQKISEIASLLQAPIIKNDRQSVESLIDSLYLFLDASNIALCKDKLPLLFRGEGEQGCQEAPVNSFNYTIKQDIGGLTNYKIVVALPMAPNISTLIFSILGITLIFGCFYIIWKFSHQITDDILLPIENGGAKQNPIRIKEVYDLLTRQENAKELELYKTRISIAKQVAHDVRSPLSALQFMIGSLENMPEDRAQIIKNVMTRMNEILDDLSQKDQPSRSKDDLKLHSAASELIAELISTPAGQNIIFENLIPEDAKLKVDSKEFKRILSNLLKNALEATPVGGKITLAFKLCDRQKVVTLTDTGRGISSDILSQLGTKPVTFGKPNGQGLGLTHAFRYLQSIGGKIVIHSKPNNGTTVELWV